MRQGVRSNLLKAGFPQVKVDEVMSTIEALPEALVESYYEMVREQVRERLRTDEDYEEKKGKGTYPGLDKL